MKRQVVIGIEEVFAGLDKLSRLREPVARAMAVAMGQEVRDEAKIRAPVLKPGNEGFDNQRAGQLREAIYLAYDGRRSILNAGHYVYSVSWNSRKAPHGHLAEFGHWMAYTAIQSDNGKWFTPIQGSERTGGRSRGVGFPRPDGGFYVQAQPFLGPAFDMKLPRLNAIAAAAATAKFQEVMK